MAMTPDEIESIRRFLGYPAGPDYRQILSGRCAEMLDAAAEGTIRAHLRQLDRLQTQMTTTVPFAAQTFNSGGSGTQQYAVGERMGSLHREANQYIDEIAATIRLGVHRRIYGQQWGSGSTMRG
ncbi:hypothetical protein IQ273_31260 [Nodosilinea sp. LEGE 07298]|uniref:hypothetical protein n=1 Tax=Nodosilinea sp. LEGE 07298 TaxID=2777970 RepID=UPI00187E0212|nr:hypothetical protein [Nodosilinea sp. LEGE 07298]MBE9113852.1 hypothetical protein [Nodosilinea sp. LEGE 07298]